MVVWSRGVGNLFSVSAQRDSDSGSEQEVGSGCAFVAELLDESGIGLDASCIGRVAALLGLIRGRNS